jgi:hypothetical protein
MLAATTEKTEKTQIDFVRAMRSVAKLTGAEIDEFMFELYSEGLRSIGWTKAIDGLKRHCLTSRRFPTVEDVIKLSCPESLPPSVESEATEIVALIFAAISKHGWPNPAQAKEMIGPVGWKLVERQGGWSSICDVQNNQIGTFRAQWKQEVESILTYEPSLRLPAAGGDILAIGAAP